MRNFADRLAGLLPVSGRTAGCSWAAAEAATGVRLPADFKELLDRTGPIVIDEWLCVFGPDTGSRNADIAVLVAERERAWETLRNAGIELPARFFDAGRRLIAFAAVEANYFFWQVRPDETPDQWGVVVVDADLDGWYELDLSATECLYQVIVGELRLDPFDDLFGRAEHSADQFGG